MRSGPSKGGLLYCCTTPFSQGIALFVLSVLVSVCYHCLHSLLQCCAIAFIENLSADSLSLTPDEFDRYMTGLAIPHDPNKVYSCDGLRILHENLETLADLKSRQETLMAEALKLQQDVVNVKDNYKKEVDEVVKRTPLVIKPRKIKIALDADLESESRDLLPSPLQPEVVGKQVTTKPDCEPSCGSWGCWTMCKNFRRWSFLLICL